MSPATLSPPPVLPTELAPPPEETGAAMPVLPIRPPLRGRAARDGGLRVTRGGVLFSVGVHVVMGILLVLGINKLGLPLLWSLCVPLVISLAVARYAWGVARKALAFTDLDATRRQLAAWFPPTQPISTESPTGEPNPGPEDPEGKTPEVAPKEP